MNFEYLEKIAGGVLVAVFGGFADYLMNDDHTWSEMFINIFLAGFAGYLVWLLCFEWEISESWTGIACGVAGMSSKTVLSLFKKAGLSKIQKIFGRDIDV